jgi:hypothetical protein
MINVAISLMNFNFDDLNQFGELDSDVVTELVVQAYSQASLTVLEKVVYACRYRMTDRNPPMRTAMPRTAEELVPVVQDHYGRRLDADSIMRVVEMAESKISNHLWQNVNDILRKHFGLGAPGY